MDERRHEHESEPDESEQGSWWVGLLAGLLAGLVIGGLVGAVAMLLLAPQSGKRTRAKLQRQSRSLRDQTAETMESVEDAMADARDKTQKMTHDARKQAEKLEKRGRTLLDG